jgi:hypothetical protein
MDDTATTPDDVTDADIGIEAAVELEHRPIPPEVLAAAFSLIVLLPDQKIFKSRLRGFANALAAIDTARKKLVVERAAFSEYQEKTKAELDARAIKLRAGEVALADKKDDREDNLAEREQRIRELEDQWRFVGEDGDVRSGFRSPEFTPLEKARRAHTGTRNQRGGIQRDDTVMISTDDPGHSLGRVTRTAKRSDLPAAIRPMREPPEAA